MGDTKPFATIKNQRRYLTDVELKEHVNRARPFFVEAKEIAGIVDETTRRAQSDEFKNRWRPVRKNLIDAGAWRQIEPKVVLGIVNGVVSRDEAYNVLTPDNVEVALVIKESCELVNRPKPTSERQLYRPWKKGGVNEFVVDLITALEKYEAAGKSTATGLDSLLDSVGRPRAGYLIHTLKVWSQREGKFGDAKTRKAYFDRRNQNRKPATAEAEAAQEPSEREQLEDAIAKLNAEIDEAYAARQSKKAAELEGKRDELQTQLDALPEEESGVVEDEVGGPTMTEQLSASIAEYNRQIDEAYAARQSKKAAELEGELETVQAKLDLLTNLVAAPTGESAASANGSVSSQVLAMLREKKATLTDEDPALIEAYVSRATSGDEARNKVVQKFLTGGMTADKFLGRARTEKPSHGTVTAPTASAQA